MEAGAAATAEEAALWREQHGVGMISTRSREERHSAGDIDFLREMVADATTQKRRHDSEASVNPLPLERVGLSDATASPNRRSDHYSPLISMIDNAQAKYAAEFRALC